jgi:hypothetical protein
LDISWKAFSVESATMIARWTVLPPLEALEVELELLLLPELPLPPAVLLLLLLELPHAVSASTKRTVAMAAPIRFTVWMDGRDDIRSLLVG